ncbi:inner membrane protein [Klebsiella pneumoniae]|uniref:Inner membrane protein n=1 Tax=Klebsiella pneumoniae TaxID=573 RepID=A0A2X3CX03_KLEPN|nr:inner membrane protein [Klebsiella pneumoniae]
MNTDNASLYVKWLKQEVAPALGCTEPVAISFAAAYAAQYLDQPCTKISGFISANLYIKRDGRHHTRHQPFAVYRWQPQLAHLAATRKRD